MQLTIEQLKEIALKVYKEVHPLLGTTKAGEKLEQGAGGDISMHIDVVAENTIIEALQEINADVLLISEEIGEKYLGTQTTIKETKAKVIVDPVDGSTNSERGIPFSCISIAYAEGDRFQDITKAVIIDLSSQDLFWAEKEKGAFLNGKTINVSERDLSDECILEVDFYLYNMLKQFKKYRSIIRNMYRLRILGSIALTFCLIAKGSVDAYLDLRKGTRLVDIAAGYLILKEAGGCFFNTKGEDIDEMLFTKEKISIACSNAKLEPFMKEELKKLY
ncbi:MAG: Inositol-1-monophosphatase [Promethearchaeota archaeon]|nr:MAG: Inositol-1-monophosphatase [Candidatus Lokiarchaeota archaeon]